jgi:hypothetical protein
MAEYDYDNYFCDGFTLEQFFDVVELFNTEEEAQEHQLYITTQESEAQQVGKELQSVVSSPKMESRSPRRKTFGAQFAELKDEIISLKLELELRDAYIFAILNELKHNKT